MQRHFDEQIAQLKHELLLMSGRAETIIRKAVESLMSRDGALAEEVFADDHAIDRMEIDIEEGCIQLLALQQPLASDLRLITSALKISSDLERVGDHAVNIAGCAKSLASKAPVKPLADLSELAEKSIAMLRDALDGLVGAGAAPRAARRRGGRAKPPGFRGAHAAHDRRPAAGRALDDARARGPEPRAHRRSRDERGRGGRVHRRGAHHQAPRRRGDRLALL